jgi:HAD superfamily hydrolase (TIGR01549 family)
VAIQGHPEAHIWLFDFDNTLAALEPEVDWAGSRRRLETFLRSERIDEAILDEFPARNLPLYNALFTRLFHDSQYGTNLLRQASAIIESYELRGVENASPLPGAIELLLELHSRGNRIAIVTSNSSRTVTRWLGLHSVAPAVRAIIGRDSMLPLKPSPAMIIRALELSEGSEPDAVVVGDSEADLHAASAAQVAFFGVSTDLNARNRLTSLGACDVFHSPADLARHRSLFSTSS